jgi:hypothetical protein
MREGKIGVLMGREMMKNGKQGEGRIEALRGVYDLRCKIG